MGIVTVYGFQPIWAETRISWKSLRTKSLRTHNAPDVVDMKKLKNGEIADKFSTGWELGTVKGVEKSGCQL